MMCTYMYMYTYNIYIYTSIRICMSMYTYMYMYKYMYMYSPLLRVCFTFNSCQKAGDFHMVSLPEGDICSLIRSEEGLMGYEWNYYPPVIKHGNGKCTIYTFYR